MSRTLSLFQYQKDILNILKEREEDNNISTIVDLICGAGKSLIICKLCIDSDKNNIIIVNKYSLNQWIDMFNKEKQIINIVFKKTDRIDTNYKINLVLDEVYEFVINNHEIYERIVIDEVSKYVKKNITALSVILLSYTYEELYKYCSNSLIDYSDINKISFYDFYFGNTTFNKYLIKDIETYNNNIYTNIKINNIFIDLNKKSSINLILNKRSHDDKFVIYTNTDHIKNVEQLLEYKLHKYLIINYNLKPEGLKKIQDSFNSDRYKIIVINTDININGISFSNSNNIIFAINVDELTKKQCIGRVIRMTNKHNIINIYSPVITL